ARCSSERASKLSHTRVFTDLTCTLARLDSDLVKTRRELGQFIVADPRICHGKPTFKGTRIMVFQVLNDVSKGKSWEFISKVRWGGRIPIAAVGEAARLAQSALLDKRGRLINTPTLPQHHAKAA